MDESNDPRRKTKTSKWLTGGSVTDPRVRGLGSGELNRHYRPILLPKYNKLHFFYMTDFLVINGKKYAEGTRKFKSSVTHHPTRGTQAYIPKDIIENWNYPDSVIFEMRGDEVVMRKARKQ